MRTRVHWGEHSRRWAVIGEKERYERLALRDARFVFLPPPVTKTPFAWCEGERVCDVDITQTPTRVGFDQVDRRFYTLVSGERVTVERASAVLFIVVGEKGQVWCDLS